MTARLQVERVGLARAPDWIYAVLPPLFWAGNFLLARMMRDDIPPLQMSFFRWLLALAILAPFAWPAMRRHLPEARRELAFLALLGLVGVTAFNCFVYVALHFTTVVNASLINSFMPVVTFLIAYLLIGQKLNRIQLFGVALSIMGALLVISRGNLAGLDGLAFNPGDLLVLCGVSCWALFTVLIRWRPSALPLLPFLFVTTAFGILFHLPLVAIEVWQVGGSRIDLPNAVGLLYLAVFPSLLAYIFWTRAVGQLGPGKASMFMHLMPVFSALLAMIFLGETLATYHLVGFCLIMIGIVTVSKAGNSQPKR